jgi:hypothetical protein
MTGNGQAATPTVDRGASQSGWAALIGVRVRDPLDAFQRCYDALSGPVGGVIGVVLENGLVLRSMKRLSGCTILLDKACRGLSGRCVSRLQMASASDIERVARLIVRLDGKVDQLEDEIDRLLASADTGRAAGGSR